MTMKIDKKIKGYEVVKADDKGSTRADNAPGEAARPAIAEVIQMHEKVERPDVLIGATYKIKSPLFEHALYVTINDIVLNAGTEYELRRPFEIFVNSKNMDHFQWIVALTRIMSAVFRKGGDVTFLVEELKAVFDPRGGYFKSGGVYMPSIVAELGNIVEQHLKMIGMLHDPELSDAQRELIAQKRKAYEARANHDTAKKKSEINTAGEMGGAMVGAPSSPQWGDGRGEGANAESAADSSSNFPPGATLCGKCNTAAMALLDGCQTCLNCGYSKCG